MTYREAGSHLMPRGAKGWECHNPPALTLFSQQTEEVQRVLVWHFNKAAGMHANRGRLLLVREKTLQHAIDRAGEYAVWMVREGMAEAEGLTPQQYAEKYGTIGLTGNMAKDLGLLGN